MSISASRLTLYSIITCIEQDLRKVIIDHVLSHIGDVSVFGNDLYMNAIARMEKDVGMRPKDPEVSELLNYIDFSDSYKLINMNSRFLPMGLSRYIKDLTTTFEKIVPIRNRVAHSRPLHFDDLAVMLELSRELIASNKPIWTSLCSTLERIEREPSFVLGIEIPTFELEDTRVFNNLPTPDFDETGFVGRTQQVSELLKLCLGPYPVITIVGDGGLGKTAIALKTAFDLLDRTDCPFDAIVWTSSKTTLLTSQDIIRIENAICSSIGVLQDISKSLSGNESEDPIEELICYLSQFKVLLIIDNLETVLDDRIRSFLERMPFGSKVVITSRIGLGALEFPVRLQPLDSSDAILLLRSLAKTRGLSKLVSMPNPQLEGYCKRMQNNPGFIKWFVSAVQAGKRPEEVLANPDLFLDFCMSNVYTYLSESSRKILRSMLCLSGRHSQAELCFLNGLDSFEIRKSLQELLTTNMVLMTSAPTKTGSSFESQYEVAELPRAYLLRHHPPASDEFQQIRTRRNQLIAASEKIQADNQTNPYSIYSLAMRSKSDVIVAKYLLDALGATKKKSYDEANHFVESAKNMAPEYFEVHRVDAWVRCHQGNLPAAQIAYEAAIDLEPNSAPLRLFYGGFLLRELDDLDESLRQFSLGEALDPGSPQIKLEIARVYLYKKRFSDALDYVTRVMSWPDISTWDKKKMYDIALQIHRRESEHCIAQRDYSEALTSLIRLKETYLSCPITIVDNEMNSNIEKGASLAMSCANHLLDQDLVRTANELSDWMHSATDMPGKSILHSISGQGTIKRIFAERRFGFIKSSEGDLFFHCTHLANGSDWAKLRIGENVKFRLGESNGKICAIDVSIL